MADVYLACMNGPGGFTKLSVIKVARLSDDPAFIQMFLDEARLAARLSHPNVVQTFEVGEENGRQFMVMEYLDGPALNVLQKRAAPNGGVQLRMLVHVLSQALDGLHHAHTLTDFDGQPLKVVHRDLTPHNLIITVQGVCKVLDFGIAKAADSRTVTQTGFYRGKLNYMSPEQARGEPVDARADVFSVGVILAEAIRRQPFWGEASGPVISNRLLAGDVPNIRGAGVDAQLEDICARALFADKNMRLRTALEFKQRLDWYLSATGGHITPQHLAAFVGPLVSEDRARIRAVVETALKNPNAPAGVTLELPKLDGPGATPGLRVAHATVTPQGAHGPIETSSDPSDGLNITVVEPVSAKRKWQGAGNRLSSAHYRAAIGAALGVFVLGAIGLGVWGWSRGAADDGLPAQSSPAAVAAPAAEAKVPEPAPVATPPAKPEPPPAAVVAPPPEKRTPVRTRERERRLKPTSPAAAAVSPPPPAQPPAPETPAIAAPPAKKSDKRPLDTDVFEDKKREIDRDPWKQ